MSRLRQSVGPTLGSAAVQEADRGPVRRGGTTAAGPDVRRSAAPVVSLRGLGKTYEPSPPWMRVLLRTSILQPVVALADVDLDVHAGQICAVVGPNGAGKSTMFRIIAGLTTSTCGSATVLGFDAHHESEAVRRLIGWMPADDRSLFLRLSCAENLYFHGRLHRMGRSNLRVRIPETLEMVGLASRASSSVFSLSAGMRARLQLARALLHHPRLLILDEPTSAVDPVAAHRLLDLIISLVREENLAALISSHRLEEIDALRSKVVLLDAGRIKYEGDLDALRRRWQRSAIEMEFDSLDSARRASALLSDVVTVEPLGGSAIRCRISDRVTVGDLLSELGPLVTTIRHVREQPLPLRDLLAHVYRLEPLATGASR